MMHRFLLLAIFLFTTSSHAASFDCSKATLPAEKIVCDTPELSNLDEKLAGMYFSVKSKAPEPDQIKQAQIRWIGDLRKCTEISCMRDTYIRRINELTSQLNSLTPQDQPPVNNQPAPTPIAKTADNPTPAASDAPPPIVYKTTSDLPAELQTPTIQATTTPSKAVDIDTRELTVFINVTLLILFLLAPFVPAFLLGRVVEKNESIVFVYHSELKAYLAAGFVLIAGVLLALFTETLILKIISASILLLAFAILISLYGFQKLLTAKNKSSLSIYALKVLFVTFGAVIVGVLQLISTLFLFSAIDNAKKRKYANAALDAAGAYAAGKTATSTSGKYFGKNAKFINGYSFEGVATAFPDDGVLNVITIGFSGLGSKAKSLEELLEATKL